MNIWDKLAWTMPTLVVGFCLGAVFTDRRADERIDVAKRQAAMMTQATDQQARQHITSMNNQLNNLLSSERAGYVNRLRTVTDQYSKWMVAASKDCMVSRTEFFAHDAARQAEAKSKP